MKKILALTLACLLALSLLAACAQTGGGDGGADSAPAEAATGTAAIESLKTFGDALAAGDEGGNEQLAMFEGYIVRSFEQDGTFYRVITRLPDDVFEQAFALEWDDPDHDAKLLEIVGSQPIDIYENLNDSILPQEELDKLVGKTGQDLFDAGWTNSGWMLDDMEFWMDYGTMRYTVIFDGKVDDPEAFEEEDIADLVVKSVSFDTVGDGTYLELDESGNIVG